MIKHLFIIFSMALILISCQNKQESSLPQASAIPVKAVSPVIKDLTLYIDSLGTLKPVVSLEIRPQVSGALTKVMVKEGEWVKAGTALFEIDRRPYAIKVQESEAQLAIEQADYQAIQTKLDRFKELASKNLIAQTEWEDLTAQAQKSRASILLNQAHIQAAKLDLEHCMIPAPIEGRVGKLDIHPGMLVAVGQTEPLATLTKLDPLLVEFTVTEKEFSQIQNEPDKIELVSLCDSHSCMQGHLTFLDHHFNPQTGLLIVRGRISNSDQALRPGQSVKIKLPVDTVKNAMLIPQKAIRYNQEGPYVYIIQPDSTVILRPLVLGREEGNEQVVVQGLDREEKIVIDGHLRLSPGIKVEIKS